MILVTGASGFVGRALLHELVQSGRRVCALSRRTMPASWCASAPVAHAVVADLEQPATLPRALEGVETVVHLAGALGGTDQGRLRAVNVTGSRNLAIAARQAGVRTFIHVSSAAVYGERHGLVLLGESDETTPASPYGRSKLDGERAVRGALEGGGATLVVMRPTGVYGGQRTATQAMLRSVLRRPLRAHLPPQVVVHPTFVDDLVHCLLRAVDAPRMSDPIVNVGGERPISYQAWLEMAATALGSRMYQWAVPAGLVARPAIALSAMMSFVNAGVAARLARFAQPCVSTAVDVSKARRLLGLSPIPLTLGMELTVAEAIRIGALRRSGSGTG